MKYVLEKGRYFIIRQTLATPDEGQSREFGVIIRHASR